MNIHVLEFNNESYNVTCIITINLNLFTGGFAYGIPLNDLMYVVKDALEFMYHPMTTPLVVFTEGLSVGLKNKEI